MNAMNESMHNDPEDFDSPVHEYSEAVRKSYKDMLGRSYVEMRFTADGLVIDSNMTFK